MPWIEEEERGDKPEEVRRRERDDQSVEDFVLEYVTDTKLIVCDFRLDRLYGNEYRSKHQIPKVY